MDANIIDFPLRRRAVPVSSVGNGLRLAAMANDGWPPPSIGVFMKDGKIELTVFKRRLDLATVSMTVEETRELAILLNSWADLTERTTS